MGNKVKLFIIDSQEDFCNPNGNMFVPGADKDASRLATMINDNKKSISDITITLDSHNKVHIAHPIWWIDSKGNHPDPFTMIDVDSVKSGKWKCINPMFQDRSLKYVETLAANGRYVLVIWPYHCLIGTKGHNVVPEVMDAVLNWESDFALANKITKGSNMFTEHYSAVKADVIDDNDRTTMLNEKLINLLKEGDEDILIAGEALSHCIAATIQDVADEFDDSQVKRFILLEDACSNVPTFDNFGEKFINDMTAKGMRISTTTDVFSKVLA